MFLDLQVGNLVEPLSGRRWLPAETWLQVARRVASYRSLGLARGDRVLIRFGNRIEFFAELLALWQLGACAVPVDSRLTDFEVGNLVQAARPRFMVMEDEAAAAAAGDPGVAVIATTHGDRADARADGPPYTGARLEDEALIQFTSGSTGTP